MPEIVVLVISVILFINFIVPTTPIIMWALHRYYVKSAYDSVSGQNLDSFKISIKWPYFIFLNASTRYIVDHHTMNLATRNPVIDFMCRPIWFTSTPEHTQNGPDPLLKNCGEQFSKSALSVVLQYRKFTPIVTRTHFSLPRIYHQLNLRTP
jgi:hypothetical protein